MFTSLQLERFKNFKDAELKLGPFTVLIGANASGKSNIRDAFRFLHGIGRGYSLADIIGEKYGEGGDRVWTGIRGGTPEICFAGARSFALTSQSAIPWDADRSARGPDLAGKMLRYHIETEIRRSKSIPRIESEDLDVVDHIRIFSSESKDYYIQNILLNPDGSESYAVDPNSSLRTSPFLGLLINEPKNSSAFTENGENTYLNSHLWQNVEKVLSCYKSMRFFDWSPDAMRQSSSPGQDVLSDNGRNLSSVLYAICQNDQGKSNLLSWIDELTPMDPVDFEFPTDPTGRMLATLIERNKHKISLASASDGMLRFLAFLGALLGPHPSSFLFFEELENGIHPTRLSLLLDLVENQVKDKNIQVVATTHSPELLGRSSKESLEHAHLIYRLPDEPDARIIRVLDLPDAERLIREQRAAELLASGWFERTARFTQPEEDPNPPRRARKRSRERAK
jgi:predicted ATPase